MSRCCSCDRVLTSFELTRKSATTGDYIDMCNKCFSTIEKDVDVNERFDLLGDGSSDAIRDGNIRDLDGSILDESQETTKSNSTKGPVAVFSDDK